MTSNMLVLIPLAVFMAGGLLFFAIYRMLVQDREVVRARLSPYGIDIGATSLGLLSSGVLRERRLSSIGLIDTILARGGLGEKIALDLARAAIPLRVGEYLLIRWLSALALFAVGVLFANVLVAALLGVFGYFVPRFYVRHAEQSRIRKFNDQLVDSLALMANSLRAGFGLLQGMEAISREMPSPISEEFSQVLHEMSVGATIDEALLGLADRVRSADLDLVVTAMLIQRTVGGNLSEILDTIAYTIRDRVRILREIKTITAQEKLSAYIIGSLPIVMVVVISFINASYVEMLFYTTPGRIMLGVATILELIGFYINKKIIAIEV